MLQWLKRETQISLLKIRKDRILQAQKQIPSMFNKQLKEIFDK